MSAATPYLLRFLIRVLAAPEIEEGVSVMSNHGGLLATKQWSVGRAFGSSSSMPSGTPNSGWLDMLMIGEPQAPQNLRKSRATIGRSARASRLAAI